MPKRNQRKISSKGCLLKTTAIYILRALVMIATLAGFVTSAHANNRKLVYQGRVLRPDGSPLEGVYKVQIKIYSPDPGRCLLWGEEKDVSFEKGAFSVEAGDASKRLAGANAGGSTTFTNVFLNDASLGLTGLTCDSGTAYTPTSTDDRVMVVTLFDGASAVRTFDGPIKAVPFAIQATNAEMVGGYSAPYLLKVNPLGAHEPSRSFSTLGFSILYNLAEAPAVDFGGKALQGVLDPVGAQDVATKNYVDTQLTTSLGTLASVKLVDAVSASSGVIAVSGGDITDKGTLSIGFADQTSGVLAAPTGGTGQPLFRLIEDADVAAVHASKITGTLGVSQGGLGQGVFTGGAIPVYDVMAGQFAGMTCSSDNEVLVWNSVAGTWVCQSKTSGAVTSVDLAMPTDVFSVAGGPVTSAGSFEVSFQPQNVGLIFAAPTGPTGTSGVPLFRALEMTDIPDLDASKIVSGTLDVLRIPDLDASKITSGTFDVLRIPDLDAAKITSGTFDVLRIPDLDASKITTGLLPVTRGGTGVDGSVATTGQLLIADGTGGFAIGHLYGASGILISNDAGSVGISIDPLASGAVTHVGFEAPSFLNVWGAPLTGAGTISLTLGTQGAAQVFAAPTGASGVPLFRLLEASDITSGTFATARIPDLDASKIVTGTLGVDRGGTGLDGSVATTGQLLIANGSGGFAIGNLYGASGILISNDSGSVGISIDPLASGAVTHVGFEAPTSVFTLTGAPLTGAGTISLGFGTQGVAQVFAAPTGASGVPGFRSLEATDITSGTFATARIPDLDASKIVTGTLAVNRGGTGLDGSVATTGQLLIANGSGGFAIGNIYGGPGVSIANQSGSLTISTTSGTLGWMQGGNSFGGTGLLGTNDNFPLALRANGAAVMTLNPGGAVGIGVTAPTAGAILEIAGTGALYSSVILPRDSTLNRPATGVAGMIRYNTDLQKYEVYESSQWVNLQTSTGTVSATVTNVGLEAPTSIFNVTGGPVTTAGTFQITLGTQGIAQVFAAPTGASGVPSFRSLEAFDITSGTFATARIPDLDASKIVTGTLAVNRGGTGLDGSVATTGQLLIANGSGGFAIGNLYGGSGVLISNDSGSVGIAIDPLASGAVTHVGFEAPTSVFTLTGAPLTGAGTISLGFGTQGIAQVFAAPTGASGVPFFRSLEAFDITSGTFATARIPDLDASKIVTGTLAVNRGGTGLDGSVATTGQLLIANGSGGFAIGNLYGGSGVLISNDSGSVGIAIDPLASGAVTHVGFEAPLSIFNVTGAPLTGAGTISVTLGTQGIAQVLAAPTGASGIPSFRSLEAFDITSGTFATARIPDLDASKIVTGTLAVNRGGTGLDGSVATTGQLLIANGSGGFAIGNLYGGSGVLISNDSGSVGIAIDPLASGAVTHVGFEAPTSVFTLTGAPLTGAGTISLGFGTQGIAQVFAAPTGASGVPFFRSLEAFDITSGTFATARIPDLDAAKIVTGTLAVNRGGTGLDGSVATTGQLLIANGSGGFAIGNLYGGSGVLISNDSGSVGIAIDPLASGAVTHVGFEAPLSIFNVTGAPLTGAGTISVTLGTQGIAQVLAAPTGASGVPSFRSLEAFDITSGTFATARIPDLDASKIVTGTLAVNRGGTGLDGSVATTGQLLIANGSGGFAIGNLYGGSGVLISNDSGSVGIAIDPLASGAVTHVGFEAPTSVFTITGSPLTGAGTIAVGFGTQGVAQVFAAPTGASGVPFFRSLEAFDITSGTFATARIPDLDASKIVTGTLGVNRGGTGLDGSVATTGQLLIANGSGGFAIGNIYGGPGVNIANQSGSLTISTTSGTLGWTQGGNAFNSVGTLGTNDNFPLVLRTNAQDRMVVTNGGSFGFGTTTPGRAFDFAMTAASGTSNGLRVVEGNSGRTMSFGIENAAGTGIGRIGTDGGDLIFSSGSKDILGLKSTGAMGLGTMNPSTGAIFEMAGTGPAASSMILPRDSTANRPVTGVAGMVRYNTDLQKYEVYEASQWVNLQTSSGTVSATVTNVGLEAPTSIFSVTGGPVTTAGTFQITLGTQGIAQVFAAPTGASGIPSFRSLEAFDIVSGTFATARIPDLDASKIVTGTLAVNRGGTGLDGSVATTGQLLIANGSGGFAIGNLYGSSGVLISNESGSIGIAIDPLASGAVTHVGFEAPTSVFTLTGAPITGAGTISLGFGTQGIAQVLAAPTGASGIPSFRSLEAFDITSGTFATARIPDLDASKIVTGTLAVNRGGTGLDGSVATTGQLLIANGSGGFAIGNIFGGPGVSIANQSGSLTISTTSGTLGWMQGGNAFGQVGTLGTNDNFGLALRTNGSTAMLINALGNIGIGTASPSGRLHVEGGEAIFGPLAAGTGNAGRLSLRELAAGGTNAVSLRAPDALAANYVLTLPAATGVSGQILTTDSAGNLSWVNNSGGTIGWLHGGNSFGQTGTLGTNDAQALAIETNNATRMTITSGGSVGIGTSSPTEILDVIGAIRATSGFTVGTMGAFIADAGNAGNLTLNPGAGVIGTGWGSELHVNAGSGSTAIRLWGDGATYFNGMNVGIGTTAPSGRLHIDGGEAIIGPLATGAGNAGRLSLRELAAGGTNAVSLRAPDALAANYVLTLPAATGVSGQILTTDASGNLAWAYDTGGTLGWLHGGNSYGQTGTLGTNDNFPLAIETNNTTRMTITAGGSIGIGTAAPSGRLHILANSADDIARFEQGDGTSNGFISVRAAANRQASIDFFAGTSPMWALGKQDDNTFFMWDQARSRDFVRVDAVGNLLLVPDGGSLGIGTSAPSGRFHLEGGEAIIGPIATGAGNAGRLQLRELIASGTNAVSLRAPDALAANYVLTLPAATGVSGQILTTDSAGNLSWVNNSGGTIGWLHGGNSFGQTGTLGTNDNQALAIETNNVTRLTITSGGSVGIGTTSPSGLFHVAGGTAAAATAGSPLILSGQNAGAGNAKGGDVILTPGAKTGTGAAGGVLVGTSVNPGWLADDSLFVAGKVYGSAGVSVLTGDLSFDDGTVNIYGVGTTADYIGFQTDTTERMRLTNTGLGLGTTAPSGRLHVEGGEAIIGPLATGAGNAGRLSLRELAAGGTNAVSLRAPDAIAANYVLTLPAATGVSGQILTTDGSGNLAWAYDTGGTLGWLQGGNSFGQTGTLGTNDNQAIDIKTNNTTRMTITASGSVGIGDPSPSNILSIIGNNNGSGSNVSLKNINTGTLAQTIYKAANDGNQSTQMGITSSGFTPTWLKPNEGFLLSSATSGLNIVTMTNNESIRFSTGHAVTPTEKMRIDSFGNVGLGTTAPSGRLHIEGGEAIFGPLAAGTGNAGRIQLRELSANGTNAVSLRAPDTIAANYVLTLPAATGTSGQLLTTDANGNLSWATNSGGSLNWAHGGNSFGQTGTLGTNDNQDLAFETNNSTRMTLTSGGSLGLGTTSPTADIEVIRTNQIASMALRTNSQSGGGQAAVMYLTSIGDFAGNMIQLNRIRGTNGSKQPVQASDALATIQFQGYGTSAYVEGARIVAAAEQNMTNTSAPTSLYFMTAPSGSATAVDRVRINSDGNVGIGEMMPQGRLHVTGGEAVIGPIATGAGNAGRLQLRELAANGTNAVSLRAPDTIAANYILTLPAATGTSGQLLTTDASGNLSWATNSGGSLNWAHGGNSFGQTGTLGTNDNQPLAFETNNVTRMTLGTTGNLAIGTTPSLDRLHIYQAVDNTNTTIRVQNAGNMGGAGSVLWLDAGTGDAWVRYQSGVAGYNWSAGLDVSDADKFKISATSGSPGPGNGDLLTLMPTGQMGLGTTAPSGLLHLNGGEAILGPIATGAGNAGRLQLRELAANGTNAVSLRAPDTIASNYVLTLPAATGASGQLLTTDASGNLNWITNSGGSLNWAHGGNTFAQTGTFGTKDYNDVVFITGGTTRMTMDRNGRMGLNTAPSSVSDIMLNVGGGIQVGTAINWLDGQSYINGSGTSITMRTNNSGSPSLFLGSANEVGVGTSAPSGRLHIVGGEAIIGPIATGAGNAGRLQLRELAANGTNAVSLRAPDTIASNYVLTLPAATGASGQLLGTDASGNLSWVTNSGGSLNWAHGGNSFGQTGTLGTNDNQSLVFETNNSPRMTINSGGSIGIGTTSPSVLVDIINTTNAQAIDIRRSSDTTAKATQAFSSVSTTPSSPQWIQGIMDNEFGWSIKTWDGSALTTRMAITTGGSVGIGLDAPSGKFHLAGGEAILGPIATGAGNAGRLQLRELAANGTNAVSLRAPDTIASNYVLTLPAATGASGQLLGTDASGNLSWVTNSGGSLNWAHGGNSFGQTGTLGTNDAQALAIETNNATRVTITSGGSVGIGTTSPTEKLDVIGAIRATSGFAVGTMGAFIADAGDIGNLTLNPGAGVIGTGWGSEFHVSAGSGSTAIRLWGDGASYFNGINVGFGTTSPSGLLHVAGGEAIFGPIATGAGNAGRLQLRELAANGTNAVSLRAPDTIASNYVLTLPAATGTSGQVLSTDASGNLSWVTSSGGTTGWAQGGNSFGQTGTLGTNDAQSFALETNNVTRMTVNPSGSFAFGIGTFYDNEIYRFHTSQNQTADGWRDNVLITTTLNPSSASSADFNGLRVRPAIATNSSTDIVSAIVANPSHDSGTGLVGQLVGFNSVPQTGANVSALNSFYAAGEILGGTTTYYAAFESKTPVISGGALTSGYGLYLNDMLGTNQYGVYQAAQNDRNVFMGTVGIGTSTPDVDLTVSRSNASTQLLVENSTSSTARYPMIQVANYMNGAGAGHPVFNFQNAAGTKASPARISNTNVLGSFSFSAWTSAGTFSDGAGIVAVAAANHTSTSSPASLTFDTTPVGSTAAVTRMTVHSNGNVGIGTTAPSGILHLIGTTSANSALILPTATTANRPTGMNGMIRYNTNLNKFEGYSTSGGGWQSFQTGTTGTSGAPSEWKYTANGTSIQTVDPVWVMVNGTTGMNPGTPLDVKGDARVQGNLWFSDGVGSWNGSLSSSGSGGIDTLRWGASQGAVGMDVHAGSRPVVTLQGPGHTSFLSVHSKDSTYTTPLYNVTLNADGYSWFKNHLIIGADSDSWAPSAQLLVYGYQDNSDALAAIVADTTNANENNNAMLMFAQDANQTTGWIGLAGTASQAFNRTVTGAIDNAFILNADIDDGSGAIQLATEDAVRLTVAPTGPVGIGTTSPQARLHVLSPSGTDSAFIQTGLPGTNPADWAGLWIATSGGANGLGGASKGWAIEAPGNGYATTSQRNDLQFSYWSGSTWATSLAMDSVTGNIGINTTGPAAQLEINTTGGGSDTPGNNHFQRWSINTSTAGFGWRHNAGLDTLVLDRNTASTWSQVLRISRSNGNVGIGSSMGTPGATLDVAGDIQYTGTITDVSDWRLKENITPLKDGLRVLRQLPVYSFTMKNDPEKKIEFGVIAQKVQEIVPQLVRRLNKDSDYLGVNYVGLIPWSIKAIQELDENVTVVQKDVHLLKQENQELKDRMDRLEQQNRELAEQVKLLLEMQKRKPAGK